MIISDSLMKPYHFIAPAIAIAGSAFWLSKQNETIQELVEKTRIIKERIVVVEKAATEATTSLGSVKGNQQDEFTLANGSLDWKKIAEMMAQSNPNGGMPTDIKAMLKLQKKMMELTEEELLNGLEQIADLDLKPQALEIIQQGLLSQLSEKNPIAALQALGDPITKQSGMLYWVQNQILLNAAKEDPTAAIAWLDQKIAAGKLESTSLNQHQDARLALESALINQLASSDYESAKSRLDGFDDDEKIYLLSRNGHNLKGEEAVNFIKLARESLPPEKASETISSTLGNQYHRKLEDISATLSNLPLSESEKAEVIGNLVQNYSRNNNSDDQFEEIYQWAKTDAPGQETALVSRALNQNSWSNPQASFEKALTVAESLGEEEIFNSFIREFSDNGNETTIARQIQEFKDSEIADQYRLAIETIPNELSDSE